MSFAVDLSRLSSWASGRGDAAAIFTQPMPRAVDNVGIMSRLSALSRGVRGLAEVA